MKIYNEFQNISYEEFKIWTNIYNRKDGTLRSFHVNRDEVIVSLFEGIFENQTCYWTITMVPDKDRSFGIVLVTNLLSFEKLAAEYPHIVLNSSYIRDRKRIAKVGNMKLIWDGRINDAIKS